MTKDPYKYFRGEAKDLLQGMSQGVLALERGEATKESFASILRLAHTLKGAARVVKLPELARHAHAFEEVLGPERERGAATPHAVIETLLQLLDTMTAELATIDAAPVAATREGKTAHIAEGRFDSVRIEVAEMDRLLDAVTETTVQVRGLRGESDDWVRARELVSTLVHQLRLGREGEGPERPGAPLRSHAIAEELRQTLDGIARETATRVEQVSRGLAEVREAANHLRLLPASTIFGPLERALRDAVSQLGKNVMFESYGGANRLDAHVLSALRDALMHVVRNAAAHGIELSADRVLRGKPAAGRVRVGVERRASKVAFVCEDDGQGVDVEALRREAVRSGALSPRESSAAGSDELFRFLLRGGLSTTSTVTEVSGRGIGLDVVRETAERLHGDVSITSTPGRGMRIEICVPVSLSSVSALTVNAADVSAVVPLDTVSRTLRLAASDIASGPDGDSVVFEGKVIPFLPLSRALRRPEPSARTGRAWSAMVVRSGTSHAAIGVDRFLGTGTSVVRPLPPHVDAEPVVFGASLDDEGNPQLVLDAHGLVLAAEEKTLNDAPPRATPLPILVVDDSLTTRMLEQSILESAGYEVALATSAEEAWEMAKKRRYGVFVVDVEMPGMDGYEFVARSRREPDLALTPAILVTSRGSDDDRQRGRDAGARGYIVKGEFDQGHLLGVIRELLG